MDDLLVCHLGQVEYRAATDLQERLRERRHRDEIGDVLLLLEHPPVYTRGRRTQDGELPMGTAWYATQGIDVVDTPRGGRVTYHGPGQLVGYAIMRTDDVVEHVRAMERSIHSASARSHRSVSISPRASRPTASRSTWTTTCSRSSGSSPAGCTRR